MPGRRRKNLSEIVAEKIRDLIIDKGLKAGDRLPTEHELARRFRVSRICVREATKALGFLGIIRGRPRRGLVVGKVDLDRVSQYLAFHLALNDYPRLKLLEARIVIETGALPYTMARMAAEPEVYDHLSEMARRIGETSDRSVQIERDVAFHRALLEASGLEPLVVFNDFLEIFFQRFRGSLLAGGWKRAAQVHQRILDALRDGKIERSQELLRTHIGYHRKSL